MSLLFGLVFTLVGIWVFGSCTVIAITESNPMMLIFGVMFLGSFGGVGIANLYPGIKNLIISAKVKKSGIIYQAQIVDYRDGAVINGVPELKVVVEFVKDDEPRRVIINTHQRSEKKYPLGAYCDIKVSGLNALIVKGSVKL